MKKIYYLLSIITLLTANSCNNEDYMLYSDDSRIQFGPPSKYVYNATYQLMDTAKSYTFVYDNASVTQDTIFFDVYTMGKTSNKDRTFKLKQVEVTGADNCVPGVHYKAFTDPTVNKHYVIPAGKTYVSAPIVFLRDASLKDKIYTLRVEIEENENFKAGETYKLWRKAYIADRLIKPNAWTTSVETYYLGKYSYVKHSWMVAQTGLKWDQDFLAPVVASYAEISYWKAKFKALLAIYNSNPANPGVPLTDETGQLVTF